MRGHTGIDWSKDVTEEYRGHARSDSIDQFPVVLIQVVIEQLTLSLDTEKAPVREARGHLALARPGG